MPAAVACAPEVRSVARCVLIHASCAPGVQPSTQTRFDVTQLAAWALA